MNDGTYRFQFLGRDCAPRLQAQQSHLETFWGLEPSYLLSYRGLSMTSNPIIYIRESMPLSLFK